MYIERLYEAAIRKAAKSFPCIVLYGARQVGKSTLIDHMFGDCFKSITLDDAGIRNLAINNPALLLENYGWPLIIDEIQKAPGLLSEIKIKIDEQRKKWLKEGSDRRLMYVLTGSNRFELQEGISESLAGRCGIIEMAPLSQREKYSGVGAEFTGEVEELKKLASEGKISYRTRKDIFSDIFAGGMPDVFTGVSDREEYFRSYVDTYIEKDVRKLIAADSEMKFRNFMEITALRVSQELHYDEIARNVGIDVRTCQRWISVLETSGIIYLLHPFFSNISSRVIKAPKLYFIDSGLCAYLCTWQNAEMLEKSSMGGAFFENYVVGEIIKNGYENGKRVKDYLFYYRDTNQKEIDLLYIKNNTIIPIEIKKGINPTKPARNFSVLDKYNLPVKTGLIIDTCREILPVKENVYSIPAYLL